MDMMGSAAMSTGMTTRFGTVCPRIGSQRRALPKQQDVESGCRWMCGETLQVQRIMKVYGSSTFFARLPTFHRSKSKDTSANSTKDRAMKKVGDSSNEDDVGDLAKKVPFASREEKLFRGSEEDESSLSPVAAQIVAKSSTKHTGHPEIEDKLLTALKERRTEDAWRLHEMLRRGGVLASQVCLSRLVAQLSHKATPSSLSRAQRVLVDLQKVEQVDLLDADSLGLLVMASARTGAARYALSILRLMLQKHMCPPVKVWSAVVSRLGKHPYDAGFALELFDEICSFLGLEVRTDSRSSSDAGDDNKVKKMEVLKSRMRNGEKIALSSTANGKRIQLAQAKECRPDTGAFNAVLNACATVGLVQQADSLLERMAFYGVEPDLFTFNILIKLFAKAEDGDQLLHILQEMEGAGIEPDLSTYNSLVSSYVSLGQLDEAERLVQSMQQQSRQPEPFKPTGSNLIDLSGQFHEDGEMTRVLQGVRNSFKRGENAELLQGEDQGSYLTKHIWRCKVKPNVRTYTTLMKGYMKNGRLKDAVQLLIAMQNYDDSNSQPNEVTYTTIMGACVSMGLMDEARSVLLEMVAQGVPANLVTYNILLKGYCTAGLVSIAYEVIEDMRNAGIFPDVVSYNTLINGCIQRDDNVGALEIFREMRNARIGPTEISYTTLMNAFARNGQPHLVREVFEEMRAHAWMRVDVVAWNVLIDGYCRAGMMDAAKQSFAEMKEQGFHPSVATYGSLVKGFSTAGKPGEVLVIWKEIQERTMAKKGVEIEPLEPDGGLLDCLVDTCLRAGFFQRALEVVSCMEGQGILADKTKYKRMFIDLYSTLYTSKHASARRLAKSADKRSAVDAFKFWLGLPNQYYQSDWRP